jgi:hypothetical protein
VSVLKTGCSGFISVTTVLSPSTSLIGVNGFRRSVSSFFVPHPYMSVTSLAAGDRW